MRVVESQLSAGQVTKCVHCDELAFRPIFQDGQTFCCEGCLTVYQVLHAKGLEEYYAIKDRAGIYKRRSPVEVQTQQYAYLDEASFRQDLTLMMLETVSWSFTSKAFIAWPVFGW